MRHRLGEQQQTRAGAATELGDGRTIAEPALEAPVTQGGVDRVLEPAVGDAHVVAGQPQQVVLVVARDQAVGRVLGRLVGPQVLAPAALPVALTLGARRPELGRLTAAQCLQQLRLAPGTRDHLELEVGGGQRGARRNRQVGGADQPREHRLVEGARACPNPDGHLSLHRPAGGPT